MGGKLRSARLRGKQRSSTSDSVTAKSKPSREKQSTPTVEKSSNKKSAALNKNDKKSLDTTKQKTTYAVKQTAKKGSSTLPARQSETSSSSSSSSDDDDDSDEDPEYVVTPKKTTPSNVSKEKGKSKKMKPIENSSASNSPVPNVNGNSEVPQKSVTKTEPAQPVVPKSEPSTSLQFIGNSPGLVSVGPNTYQFASFDPTTNPLLKNLVYVGSVPISSSSEIIQKMDPSTSQQYYSIPKEKVTTALTLSNPSRNAIILPSNSLTQICSPPILSSTATPAQKQSTSKNSDQQQTTQLQQAVAQKTTSLPIAPTSSSFANTIQRGQPIHAPKSSLGPSNKPVTSDANIAQRPVQQSFAVRGSQVTMGRVTTPTYSNANVSGGPVQHNLLVQGPQAIVRQSNVQNNLGTRNPQRASQQNYFAHGQQTFMPSNHQPACAQQTLAASSNTQITSRACSSERTVQKNDSVHNSQVTMRNAPLQATPDAIIAGRPILRNQSVQGLHAVMGLANMPTTSSASNAERDSQPKCIVQGRPIIMRSQTKQICTAANNAGGTADLQTNLPLSRIQIEANAKLAELAYRSRVTLEPPLADLQKHQEFYQYKTVKNYITENLARVQQEKTLREIGFRPLVKASKFATFAPITLSQVLESVQHVITTGDLGDRPNSRAQAEFDRLNSDYPHPLSSEMIKNLPPYVDKRRPYPHQSSSVPFDDQPPVLEPMVAIQPKITLPKIIAPPHDNDTVARPIPTFYAMEDMLMESILSRPATIQRHYIDGTTVEESATLSGFHKDDYKRAQRANEAVNLAPPPEYPKFRSLAKEQDIAGQATQLSKNGDAAATSVEQMKLGTKDKPLKKKTKRLPLWTRKLRANRRQIKPRYGLFRRKNRQHLTQLGKNVEPEPEADDADVEEDVSVAPKKPTKKRGVKKLKGSSQKQKKSRNKDLRTSRLNKRNRFKKPKSRTNVNKFLANMKKLYGIPTENAGPQDKEEKESVEEQVVLQRPLLEDEKIIHRIQRKSEDPSKQKSLAEDTSMPSKAQQPEDIVPSQQESLAKDTSTPSKAQQPEDIVPSQQESLAKDTSTPSKAQQPEVIVPSKQESLTKDTSTPSKAQQPEVIVPSKQESLTKDTSTPSKAQQPEVIVPSKQESLAKDTSTPSKAQQPEVIVPSKQESLTKDTSTPSKAQQPEVIVSSKQESLIKDTSTPSKAQQPEDIVPSKQESLTKDTSTPSKAQQPEVIVPSKQESLAKDTSTPSKSQQPEVIAQQSSSGAEVRPDIISRLKLLVAAKKDAPKKPTNTDAVQNIRDDAPKTKQSTSAIEHGNPKADPKVSKKQDSKKIGNKNLDTPTPTSSNVAEKQKNLPKQLPVSKESGEMQKGGKSVQKSPESSNQSSKHSLEKEKADHFFMMDAIEDYRRNVAAKRAAKNNSEQLGYSYSVSEVSPRNAPIRKLLRNNEQTEERRQSKYSSSSIQHGSDKSKVNHLKQDSLPLSQADVLHKTGHLTQNQLVSLVNMIRTANNQRVPSQCKTKTMDGTASNPIVIDNDSQHQSAPPALDKKRNVAPLKRLAPVASVGNEVLLKRNKLADSDDDIQVIPIPLGHEGPSTSARRAIGVSNRRSLSNMPSTSFSMQPSNRPSTSFSMQPSNKPSTSSSMQPSNSHVLERPSSFNATNSERIISPAVNRSVSQLDNPSSWGQSISSINQQAAQTIESNLSDEQLLQQAISKTREEERRDYLQKLQLLQQKFLELEKKRQEEEIKLREEQKLQREQQLREQERQRQEQKRIHEELELQEKMRVEEEIRLLEQMKAENEARRLEQAKLAIAEARIQALMQVQKDHEVEKERLRPEEPTTALEERDQGLAAKHGQEQKEREILEEELIRKEKIKARNRAVLKARKEREEQERLRQEQIRQESEAQALMQAQKEKEAKEAKEAEEAKQERVRQEMEKVQKRQVELRMNREAQRQRLIDSRRRSALSAQHVPQPVKQPEKPIVQVPVSPAVPIQQQWDPAMLAVATQVALDVANLDIDSIPGGVPYKFISTWTSGESTNWFKCLTNNAVHINRFIQEELDGSVLCEIPPNDLVKILELPLGPGRKLSLGIRILREYERRIRRYGLNDQFAL